MTARHSTPVEEAIALTMRAYVIVETQQPAAAAAASRPHHLAGQATATDVARRELEGRQLSLGWPTGHQVTTIGIVKPMGMPAVPGSLRGA